MKETSERKRIAYEVMEGGLRGSPAARAFSWTLIILIILSITFMLIWDLEGAERWHKIFEVIPKIAEKEGLSNGFRVISNAGPDACQSVHHIHFHVLGGQQMAEKMA